MNFKKIYLLLFLLTFFVMKIFAQSSYITLNQTIYTDGSVCSNLDSTHLYGIVYSNISTSSQHYIKVNYGDGDIDTIQMDTYYGGHFFNLFHKYATLDTFNVKIISYDSLFNKTDSVQSLIKIGGCQEAKGTFFYDCNHNCDIDPFEQVFSNQLVSFNNNGVVKSVYLDSMGRFNIPIYPGDSYSAINPSSYLELGYFCSYPNGSTWSLTPIINGGNNYLIPIVLPNNQTMGFSDALFYLDYFLCKNSVHSFNWNIYHSSSIFNNNYAVRVDPGDGTSSGYSTGGNFIGSQSHLYNDTGIFNVKVKLYYSPGYGGNTLIGPIMVKEKLVSVQDCHPVNVKFYSDANQDCQQNSTEFQYNMNSGYGYMYSTKRNGGSPYTTNPDGSISTYLWGNDTVYRPEYIGYTNSYSPNWWSDYFQILPSTCTPHYMTNVDDSVSFAYKPGIILGELYDNNSWYYCKGDTLIFTMHGNSVGYPLGTPLKLLAIYTDGLIDTFNFIPTVMDSFSYTFSKTIITTDSFSAIFVLSGNNGTVADTLEKLFPANNCAFVKVKAYYDLNRNCLKDANEIWLKNFKVETQNATSEYNQLVDSHTVRLNIYNPNDTLFNIKLYSNSQFGSGLYTRIFTQPLCSWPILSYDTGTYIIPLVDTVNVQDANLVNGYNQWPEVLDMTVCDSMYYPTLKGTLSGNRNALNGMFFLFNPGDGSPLDSVPFLPIDNFNYNDIPYYVSASNKAYANGTYFPSYKLIKASSAEVLYTYIRPVPPLFVNYNCQKPKAILYFDEDANCIKQSGEALLENVVVNVIQNGNLFTTITDANGYVYFNATNGDQIIINTPQLLGSGISLSTNCGIINSYIFNDSNNDTLKIPYQCNTNANVNFGVVAGHQVFANNLIDTILIYPQYGNCYYATATLGINLDSSLTFLGSSLSGHQQNGNNITWEISNMNSLVNPVKVAVALNTPPDNTYLCNVVTFYPDFADADSSNNQFILCDTVFSYVPDLFKTGVTDSLYLQTGIPIVYSIHFENTTTDTISQIILIDTISPLLNLSSLQTLYSTHHYNVSIINSNVLKIMFPTIDLIPNATGMIQFSLLPLGNVSQDISIYNQAIFVFDALDPMLCKAAVTSSIPLDVRPPDMKAISILAYPNPVTQILNVSISGDLQGNPTITLLDLTGKILVKQKLKGNKSTIDLRGFTNGAYLLMYQDEKWKETIKISKTN